MRVNPWVCFDNTFLLVVSQVSGKRKAPGVKGTESLTCAREGIRTPNLLIRSQMLYPLSYGRLGTSCNLAEPTGLSITVPN